MLVSPLGFVFAAAPAGWHIPAGLSRDIPAMRFSVPPKFTL